MSVDTDFVASMTHDDVAKVLNCSTRTVYRLRESGQLPHFRVGRAYRFRAADVKAFAEGGGFTVTGAKSDANFMAHVQMLVEKAPEFSDEQIDKIAALMRAGRAAK